MNDVVKACGTNCVWSLNSLTKRTGSTTGSRFALDNRELHNNPITGRGLRLQQLNLKRTPNIQLFCCHLKEFPAHRMPIYLHWVGLERARDTNYFTYNEVAVINMVLNLTRLFLVHQDEERHESMTDQLSKLKLFETTVPGPSEKSLKAHTYRLSSFSMLEFSQVFMDSLYTLSTDEDEFDQAFTKYMTGMDFLNDLGEKVHKGYMKTFCRSLNHNCFFVASLAGCKEAFHENDDFSFKFQSEDHLNIEKLQQILKRTTSDIYKSLREKVFVCKVVEEKPRRTPPKYRRDDGGIQYHFDFGIEFSPLKEDNVSFLLSGYKTMAKFKIFMNKRRTIVPFTPEDEPDTVDDTSTGDDDSHVSQFPDEPDPQLVPIEEPLDFFTSEDTALFELGEVQSPNEARIATNYGSDSEEEGEILHRWFHYLFFRFS